jgi:hypothetical protein
MTPETLLTEDLAESLCPQPGKWTATDIWALCAHASRPSGTDAVHAFVLEQLRQEARKLYAVTHRTDVKSTIDALFEFLASRANPWSGEHLATVRTHLALLRHVCTQE